MNIVCAFQRITRAITKALDATDHVVSDGLNRVGGGFAVCDHTYSAWSDPVENRDHKYGAFRIIKRDAILLSVSKHRTCTKCGNVQTNTVAAC